MIKKLARHGNSMALVMEKGVLELLKIGPDTPLRLSTDGEALIVSPVRDGARRGKFSAALRRVNRAHGRALRRLAD